MAYNLWEEMARLQARVLAGTVLAGTANGGGISSPTDGGSSGGGISGGGEVTLEVADRVMIEGKLHDVIVINGQRYAIDPANPNGSPAYRLGEGADGGATATLDATFHDRIRFGEVPSSGADGGTGGGIDGGAGDGGSGGGAGDGGSSGGTDDGGTTVQQTNVVLKLADGSYLTAAMTLGSTGSDFLHQAGFVYGGAGNDSIVGYSGNDIIDGGNGNDWMDGGAGSDVMDGRSGWDVVSYQSAASGITVDLTTNVNSGAAAGDKVLNVEVLQGSNHADRLTGLDRGNGNGVQLYGEGGDDGLTGKAGGDALFGGAGNDWLDGGPGGDLLDGGAGWDVLSYQSATGGVVVDLTGNQNGGAAAGDQVSNIEVLQGSNYADTLTSVDRGGGSGAQLYGEGGNDTLYGRGGGDYLFGGAGDDLLDSGFGCDVLSGGAGADTFRFSTGLGAGNVDTLQDLSLAQGDRILLSRSVFAGAGYDALAGAAFTLGTAATTAVHRIVYDQETGDLFYDADGVGGAAQVKFAVLANHASLTAANFQIL
ncbi:calcium-binding protein [Microvirga yunnanensis]|uniref:calcium-binding protein n=1 Tax=Microvirga yunnanensis TaxID=2953740 RepID=UPI0021CA57EA|nr:calcium-binding protein [Microvirga sp. HBU67655]